MTRGIQWLAISALVALLVSRYVSISSGELDDFAVLRASAWLRTCAPDDDVPRVLHDHLASHADALPMAARERFRLRMDFVSNYVLTGPILRLLEGSMGVSALRAATGACLLQHLLALGSVLGFSLVWWRHTWLPAALLVGALAASWHWPEYLGSLLAFQRENMTWSTAAPRGAAVLAWFGALLAVLAPNKRSGACVALGLFALSLLCHRSMALLYIVSTLPILALWLGCRVRLPGHAPAPLVFGGFLALALGAAGLKLALLLYHDPQVTIGLGLLAPDGTARSLRYVVRLSAWALQILLLLHAWGRARLAPTLVAEMRPLGDAVAVLLGVTGAVALGLNAVNLSAAAWHGPLYFLHEASQRIAPAPQLLLLALAGITLQALLPVVFRRSTLAIGGLVCVLSGLACVRAERRTLPTRAPGLAQLLAQGPGAYSDEVVYYSSVGTQIARKGCGPILDSSEQE